MNKNKKLKKLFETSRDLKKYLQDDIHYVNLDERERKQFLEVSMDIIAALDELKEFENFKNK